MSKEDDDDWCYYSGMPSPNAYNKTNISKEEITMNGRIYDKDKLKEEYSKLVEAYKDRTDLDIQHPTPKLKWWKRLFNIKPKQR